MMKKRKLGRLIFGIVFAIFLVTLGASFYFFHVAQVRGEKSFINYSKRKKTDPLYIYEQNFDKLEKTTLEMTNLGVKQDAWYVPSEKPTTRTVITVHGFTNSKKNMKAYAWLFHKLGYNVLIPDNMAHGDSEGELIGYGWNDRLNVIKWSQYLVDEMHATDINLFGVSMGAATVMMASGETLPSEVKTIIEDCGYTSVWDELKFQAKEMYHLPAFPILYEVSSLSKIRAGFSYGQASSVKQLKKNHLPILFIHGSKDTFVPTQMVYENYKASKAPKELYVAKGAGHAKSFEKNPKIYEDKITSFLKKYDK